VWLTHLTLVSSSLGYCYGLDTFLRIALFFCVFAPVGHALSVDVIAGRVSGAPSFAARLALRALQVELAIVYASTGIAKASGVQWWNGEALWRSWMRADLGTIDFSWVASMPWVAMDRDGRTRAGVDAFFALWAHAWGLPPLQALSRLAPVRTTYALFARHRHALCRGQCAPAGPAGAHRSLGGG
jgi:hypothetical protein